MADYYKYNSSQGIIVPDTGTVKEDVEQEFQNAFGADLDLTASTPQGRLIEIETLSRQGTVALCALVANQINLDYATGQYLDAIGAFFGVDRRGAIPTRVLATITGVPGTIITAGSLAQTDAGDQFYLENQTTIPAGGETTSYFLSVETGAVPCDTNTLNTIISQTIGWESINNPAVAVIGKEQESDRDYKTRIKSARFTGISLLQSIRGALNLVDGVRSSFVYDNPTGSAITYDGVSIPAHSILAVVDGGADLDVATAIFEKKSSGSGYTAITNQSVSQTVNDGAYGVGYDVVFNRPQQLGLGVWITVKKNTYTGTDDELKKAITQALIDWANGEVSGVDGLKIGQSVSSWEIGAAVSQEIPDIYIQNVLINNSGTKPTTNPGMLDCTIAQIYYLNEEWVNITINN